MFNSLAEPFLRAFGSVEALPPAWRELLEETSGTLARVEQERDRYALALDRSTRELHELVVELEALRRARSAAESANLVRGEILAKVGRTMRAPSDAILGLTSLLRSGALLPTQRAYVEAVHGAGETLRGLLNDVSDFSRLEAGTLPLEPIGFDLRVMVEDVAGALGTQAEAKGLALRLGWRPDAPRRVTGDPGRLRQILSAMVGDAITRARRGEVSLEVSRATLNLPGGGVRFTVEDAGPAIPAELIPTLFEPFTRGDAYHGREGNLSLPIARQLSHLMGGELEVANVTGAGSRFTASLPLTAIDEPTHPAPVPSGGEDADRAEAGREHVIVVEADADQRASWAAIAEAAGFHASGVAGRDEALAELARLAETAHPAVAMLFSDHAADGYEEVGRQLLAGVSRGAPALVMLPAVGHPGDARRLREAGFRGYLVKPVAPSDLREALELLRRTPREAWPTLFLTRHFLAEARRGGTVPDVELDASLEHLIGPAGPDGPHGG